jgi:hypothetical protein
MIKAISIQVEKLCVTRVVVAASTNEPSTTVSAKVAVINFTMPANPIVVLVTVFRGGGGCVVDIDDSNAVTGNASGREVKLIDVSNPSAPVIRGTIDTQLPEIGAIAISSTQVVVGERNGSRIKLIDFSTPNNPQILGTANGVIGGLSSIAFIRNNVVAAASPNDFRVVIVNFTNPSNPQVNLFNPALSGAPTLDADSNRISTGDTGGTNVKIFDGSNLTVLANRSSNLQTLDSIALSGQLALAGSNNDFHAALINFGINPPTVIRFNTQLNGGCTTAIEDRVGTCGAVLGSSVKLFDISGQNPSLAGTASNIGIDSISSLGISTF